MFAVEKAAGDAALEVLANDFAIGLGVEWGEF